MGKLVELARGWLSEQADAPAPYIGQVALVGSMKVAARAAQMAGGADRPCGRTAKSAAVISQGTNYTTEQEGYP